MREHLKNTLQKHIDLQHEKCALFSPQGELLWLSPAWGHPPECNHQVLGTRWWEFVYSKDLGRLLAFLAGEGGATCSFRAMLFTGGIVRITYSRQPWGENVFVLGEVTIIADYLPAAPCLS